MQTERAPTVLITGASRGIGAALAQRYAQSGASVIGTARYPADPDMLPLDVTRIDSQRALALHLRGQPLDILICNAGIYPDRGAGLDQDADPDLWAAGFATNVTGVFLTIQSLLPNLLTGTAPRIAIISSQMGSSTRATGGSYIYRASKAAAINLGRNLARDLAPKGIVLGIYHPGWVKTDMGGAGADISAAESAAGLTDRISSLTAATTGSFETWDGRPHPF